MVDREVVPESGPPVLVRYGPEQQDNDDHLGNGAGRPGELGKLQQAGVIADHAPEAGRRARPRMRFTDGHAFEEQERPDEVHAGCDAGDRRVGGVRCLVVKEASAQARDDAGKAKGSAPV